MKQKFIRGMQGGHSLRDQLRRERNGTGERMQKMQQLSQAPGPGANSNKFRLMKQSGIESMRGVDFYRNSVCTPSSISHSSFNDTVETNTNNQNNKG